jgi:hypothetical protein
MTTEDNAFRAKGTKPHLDYDYVAYPGDKKTWAVRWGFVTTTQDYGASINGDEGVFPRGPKPMFRWGGSFGGWVYGVAAYAGDPDDNDNVGPAVNDYSNFAGVFGTGVFVNGVAGTSTNNIGVYGQSGDDPNSSIPEGLSAGVVGVVSPPAVAGVPSVEGTGVIGWSPQGEGVWGMARQGTGVLGQTAFGDGVTGISDMGAGVRGLSSVSGVIGVCNSEGPPLPPQYAQQAGVIGTSSTRHGVVGTSDSQVGVFGYSKNLQGIYGRTDNPAAYAGVFVGNVVCFGTLTASAKNALVPFPDGSQRVLHCMESPEHWFEDFGSAKLARGRAVIKLDADFAKIITRDYRVFLTPEGDCRGLYVRRRTNSFEVRELAGGKSSSGFSYRIVGRRKDIKGHRRFAKIDTRQVLPTTAVPAARESVPTAAGLRAFTARVEKKARERMPKGAEKARARMRISRARAVRG